MPTVDDVLKSLLKLAKSDPALAAKLLATADSEHPVAALCALSTELGYPIYEMDLISAGEEYYAAMRRSTNGGGENSPLLRGEDDYYELFMAELRSV
ncbi:MAG: hypothetical protein Q4B01_09725 [Eubacteriales bacterium]|nr:hypothetical protein [Eubacteriales bacterium]